MRIAIPIWQGRISPVFDTARRLACFDVEDTKPRLVGEMELPADPPHAKVAKLRELGVKVLLCGAISAPFAAMISATGIRLIPFLAGDAEEVVDAFASGRLRRICFRMPGCCGRHRWRHGMRWR